MLPAKRDTVERRALSGNRREVNPEHKEEIRLLDSLHHSVEILNIINTDDELVEMYRAYYTDAG